MERENKEVVTLSGKKVVIRAYLTGPEANEIKRTMFEGIEMTPPEPGEAIDKVKIPLSSMINREPKLLQISVVSFENSADQTQAIELINQLPSSEYADLIAQIDEVQKGTFPAAK